MSQLIERPALEEVRTRQAGAAPRWVRRVGYAALAAQLIAMAIWSTIQYDHFAETLDFTMYHQAWVLIAHGNLNPFNSCRHNYFWQDHSEFLVWPMALLYWVWPHGVVLLWLQDACVVGAQALAFTWLCELAVARLPGSSGRWLAGVGLFLLVANPWIWWTISQDFHSETIALPFAVLLAWDMRNGRRRASVWLVPLLASGDVAATYVAAIGLGAMLASRRLRLRGLALVCAGITWTVAVTLVHGNLGSGHGLQAYGYLAGVHPASRHLSLTAIVAGVLLHPLGVLEQLRAHRLDIWANLAPSGLIGIGYLWLAPLALSVVAANNLFTGGLFAPPSFQGLPLYIFVPVGTVAVLAALARRRRWGALVVGGLLVAQAAGYAAVWMPRTASQWMPVSWRTAATLASVQDRIPASAQVLASQGVMGRFANRDHIMAIFNPGPVPLRGGQTWFVITPTAGIETLLPADAMALIAKLAGPLHATLVAHSNGVWAFRWRPPTFVHSIVVPAGQVPLAAWTHPGPAGRDVLTGPATDWHVTSTGSRGYVADGLAWQKAPGAYRALVRLSATGPVNVEVWNDNGDVLLARQSITPTTRATTIDVPVPAMVAYQPPRFSGWGPFRAIMLPPPAGQRIEIRVWSPGGQTVDVYQAELVPAGR